LKSITDPLQDSDKTLANKGHSSTLHGHLKDGTATTSTQQKDTFLHRNYVQGMHEKISPDLAAVIAAWEKLSAPIRRAVLALVTSASEQEGGE